MAYTFNGTSQYLKETASTGLVSGWPLTLFCRVKSSNLTTTQFAACYIYTNSPYSAVSLICNGPAVGDPLVLSRFGASNSVSSESYASGAWRNVAGRISSNTVSSITVDNTIDAGPSTSVAFSNASAMMVGARLIPGFDGGLTGSVAAVAMWSAALDDAEVASLVAGFSPRRVRPQSLRWYAPLVRELVVPSRYVYPSSALANVNAATVSDHPRSYGM